MTDKNRLEAVRLGLIYYMPEKPCGNGHMAKRRVANRQCVECKKATYFRNYAKHAPAARARAAAWAKANPERRTATQRLRRTGFSPAMFSEAMEAQGKACALCFAPFGKIKPNADHCHKTGRPRGILCGRCNTRLGGLKDDHIWMSRAVRYLRRYL